MSLKNDIDDLLEANVISAETASRIRAFYTSRQSSSSNRLYIVFGVLGAVLVGLGIILILAHNWDHLTRLTKSVIAFIPLIIGQVMVGFSLFKKANSKTWSESSSVFLFFAIGACIALISQIYHIQGEMASYILTWMLLTLPVIYIMRSSMLSLLYLIGITYYACEVGYFQRIDHIPWLYLPLLLPVLYHYYLLVKDARSSNFTNFHHWLIPISLLIILGSFSQSHSAILIISYCCLLGMFYIVGSSTYLDRGKLMNNGYKVIGALGSIGILLATSFGEYWKHIKDETYKIFPIGDSIEIWVAVLLFIACSYCFYSYAREKKITELRPIAPVFILFSLIFLIGHYSSIAHILSNLLVFAIGILTIRQGASRDHLGILNYGLLIITALVICRFFDTNISFVIRGILFVSVGIAFFITNYWMLKTRKQSQN